MAECKLTLIIIQRMIQGNISLILISQKNLQTTIFDGSSTSSLVSEGYNNWKHLSEILKVHENSISH